MNSMWIKANTGKIIFLFLTVGIFIQGCATQDKAAVMSSGKVLVMDLSESSEYQPLLEGAPQTCGMRSGRVYLKPGETCGRHSTEAHEEMLVFLSGSGIAYIGDEQTPYEVGAGKICYIPPFTTHDNKNTGTEPLVYIYCVTPVGGMGEPHTDSAQDRHDH
jgi:mannose-6-phosphate isomerase-like protein (cupin superfamily)